MPLNLQKLHQIFFRERRFSGDDVCRLAPRRTRKTLLVGLEIRAQEKGVYPTGGRYPTPSEEVIRRLQR